MTSLFNINIEQIIVNVNIYLAFSVAITVLFASFWVRLPS
jgi:hypothetical protein